jgi:anthranilate phosphoribosyltransferase
MRARAVRVSPSEEVVDVVGTGGDGLNTFNISTAAAFVAAGAGLKVAKHGNRAASSQCGSADVLEALGVKIELTAPQVERCIETVGIGFMLAPVFHPAMKHAGGPRREIGIRTVFNILGPLTNPAGASCQLIGVPGRTIGEKVARALSLLGTRHALVVNGSNGMDEISLSGSTRVWESTCFGTSDYRIAPGDFGFRRAALKTMNGGTAAENAQTIRAVLGGEKGPRRNVVVMNAAAAIAVGTRKGDGDVCGIPAIVESRRAAEESVDSGQALAKLDRLVELTRSLS